MHLNAAFLEKTGFNTGDNTMVVDFTANKLRQEFKKIQDPQHLEVAEALLEGYVSGELNVAFIDGQPYFQINPESQQLELQLEV